MPYDGSNRDGTILHNLIAARALINKPDKWCRKVLCRDTGLGLQRCAMGALNYTKTASSAYPLRWSEEYPEVYALADHTPMAGQFDCIVTAIAAIVHLNNEEGWAAVMAMFDRAIETEKARLPALT